MRIIGRKIIDKFKRKHGDSRKALDLWMNSVNAAQWKTFQDIKNTYASASFLNDNRVIFNIKGNNYRLVTIVVIQADSVFIEWIGTHAEYDKKTF